jgi:chemotaxis family two-component system response regulator Rcp1
MPTDADVMHVLLVEDNPGDVLLTQEALATAEVATLLTVVGDGDAAIAYLDEAEGYEGRVRPDLVLLDLNLPGTMGREVLSHVKADSRLRGLPVVVLTSSRARADVADAYDRHANTYVAKPMAFEDYDRVIRCIEEYWFRAAELPPVTS